MKKTILIQLFILFAFSTISMAQSEHPKLGANLSDLQVVEGSVNIGNILSYQTSACTTTNFALGQPDNGSIRTIEVVTQGHRNTDGDCVFDVLLYMPPNFPEPENIKWEIDGTVVVTDSGRLSVPVPESGTSTTVFVSYTIGNQNGADSRTFYVQ